MQDFWLEEYVLLKSIYKWVLTFNFLHQVLVQLTIMGEQLSNITHGGRINLSIQQYSSSSLFHFLLYVAKGLSSLNNREKRTIRIEFVNLARQT